MAPSDLLASDIEPGHIVSFTIVFSEEVFTVERVSRQVSYGRPQIVLDCTETDRPVRVDSDRMVTLIGTVDD